MMSLQYFRNFYSWFRFFTIKGYIFYSGLICIVVFVLSSVLGISIYYSYQKLIEKELEISSIRIENILDDIFSESNRLMVFMGKQIANANGKNLNFINKILKDTSGKEYKLNNVLEWSCFDWLSPHNLQLASSGKGILQTPADMSHRSYCWQSRLNPWTIQFSEPAIGNPSGIWVIPAGTGVTNKNGDFLGIIALGFNIEKLTAKIMQKLANEKAVFIIFNDNFNIVLHNSGGNVKDFDNAKFKELIDIDNNHFSQFGGLLRESLRQFGITYRFYKRMKKYPFIILSGMKNSTYYSELSTRLLPPLLGIFGMGVLSILVLYWAQKRIIKLSKASDKAREEFVNGINQKLQKGYDQILQYSDPLTRYFKGEINIGMNQDRVIEFIANIHDATLNLKNLSTNMNNFSIIDVNQIIKNALPIFSKFAIQNNISLKAELDTNPILIEGDELCVKQIFCSLLASSLECMPSGGRIWISTALDHDAENSTGTITIRDNGFGLCENTRQRIKKRIYHSTASSDNFINTDNFNLEISAIENLIDLHKGHYHVKNTEGKGRIVTINFPRKY